MGLGDASARNGRLAAAAATKPVVTGPRMNSRRFMVFPLSLFPFAECDGRHVNCDFLSSF